MSGLSAVLVVLVALHVSAADEHQFTLTEGLCPGEAGHPEASWRESIKAYMRRIPSNITLPPMFDDTSSGGLELGSLHLYGLDTMWTYKPYHAYCTEEGSFLEVTAFAHATLGAAMKWKTCGGGEGEVVMQARAKKLRLIFQPHSNSENPTHVQLSKIHPDVLDDVEMYMTGATKGITRMVNYPTFLLKHNVEMFWRLVLSVAPRALSREHAPGEP